MTLIENTISDEELARTLQLYAGPSVPRKRIARRPRLLRRLALATAALALLLAAAAYAGGFNPFRGISAANHPATSEDNLPAPLQHLIEQFNPTEEKNGIGKLLPDSARFVRELPSGTRFYVVATSTHLLCLATLEGLHGSNGFSCGSSLSRSWPITIDAEHVRAGGPWDEYGLAMDGVTSVSFIAHGVETTVPVKDNVWAYEGWANTKSVTVHWADGRTQTLSG